jgi:carbonic anhydrase/acetyltransferase-like protein (isoleucine patch superfamily)
VRIGANCDLRECIIGRDVHIADGVKIGRGALIGNGVRIGKGAQIPDYARVGRERWRAEDDDEEEEDEEEESEEEKGKSSIKVRAVADFSPTRKNPWQRLCGSSLASGGGRTSRRLGR